MGYGRINHVCFIVKDWKEATERYSKLFGIKHWYEIVIDKGTLDVDYRGQKVNSELKLIFGGKGQCKIELVDTKGDKNFYDEWYEKHGEAPHHIMYMTKNFDKTIEEFKGKGFQVFQNASYLSGGVKVRYAYMGPNEDGPIFEFVECSITKHIKKGDMPFEVQLGQLSGSYKKIK